MTVMLDDNGHYVAIPDHCIACKFESICKVPTERRKLCKVNVTEDGKIFGRTWQEISDLQQKKS